jgi:hypothetical protein
MCTPLVADASGRKFHIALTVLSPPDRVGITHISGDARLVDA